MPEASPAAESIVAKLRERPDLTYRLALSELTPGVFAAELWDPSGKVEFQGIGDSMEDALLQLAIHFEAASGKE